jgi:hypothetical protein
MKFRLENGRIDLAPFFPHGGELLASGSFHAYARFPDAQGQLGGVCSIICGPFGDALVEAIEYHREHGGRIFIELEAPHA